MSRIPLVILGAGGTGLDVADFVDDLNDAQECFEVLGFLDDNPALQGHRGGGLPVLGPLSAASAREFRHVRFVDALGSPRSFRRRPGLIGQLGLDLDRFASVVHPLARISRRAAIGPGCIIYPFVSVNADVKLGAHTIVLANSSINHHATLGDFTIVTSNVAVSGHVQIGDCCYLGTGSCLIQGVSVGAGSLIGMGSVIRHDLPEGSTAFGNPAHSRTKPDEPPVRFP